MKHVSVDGDRSEQFEIGSTFFNRPRREYEHRRHDGDASESLTTLDFLRRHMLSPS